jgi:hypothetical protein
MIRERASVSLYVHCLSCYLWKHSLVEWMRCAAKMSKPYFNCFSLTALLFGVTTENNAFHRGNISCVCMYIYSAANLLPEFKVERTVVECSQLIT